MEDFHLTTDMLVDISRVFRERVRTGLARDDGEIRCLPTFVPVGRPLSGNTAYAMDLGGSNLRAGLARRAGGRTEWLRGPVERSMPWRKNAPLARDEFLEIQTDLLASLGCRVEHPLGYCFSYPATATRDRDAVLLDWTKGIDVPGTRGKRVGAMLAAYLRRRTDAGVGRVTVVNDTVAALFAGLARGGPGARLGLVAGTGTNMAAFVHPPFIPKLDRSAHAGGMMPVNLESGNFHPPHLTDWDRIVDAASENPGRQRFEKAVSGLYLSRIFKAVFPESSLDAAAGAKGLIDMCQQAGRGHERETARMIYIRSARLAAAALCGLVHLLLEFQSERQVLVTAEGALFYSRLDDGTSYASIVESTSRMLLEKLGRNGVTLSIVRIRDANLLGAAMAALS